MVFDVNIDNQNEDYNMKFFSSNLLLGYIKEYLNDLDFEDKVTITIKKEV